MKLYNSYSRQVENFQPIDSSNVKMYVCGITPYDTTHLGHAFVYVTFDALKQFLEFKGYKVTYTQNVTDIDDDILKRAKRDGKNWQELGNFWTGKFLNDLKSLNVKMPDHYIKATEAMSEIIEMVSTLIKKGFAYEVNGNVYFEVSKFPDYGKLSKFSQDQMTQLLKERGGNPDDPNKKAPLDFLLWQKSKEDEPFWDSPFSKGRPGWHIECSAMIKRTLGEQIDIHGGGMDLIYPHHESELAQSEAYSGKKPFVKNWMHIAMVSYQGEKMSKSLGNLVLVYDLLKKYSPNAIRLMLLLNHYRKPWEYTEEQMKKAQEIIDKLETNFRHTPERWEAKLQTEDRLLSGLEEDFNTGFALKRLIDESAKNPSKTKAGFELLGFRFLDF
ncbi:MAG TPA: cysteine--tRNA ligase [Patescibacteria group bacterium]|nr:cysteine--tRNA ligase [Patescibacteria group bacterium]